MIFLQQIQRPLFLHLSNITPFIAIGKMSDISMEYILQSSVSVDTVYRSFKVISVCLQCSVLVTYPSKNCPMIYYILFEKLWVSKCCCRKNVSWLQLNLDLWIMNKQCDHCSFSALYLGVRCPYLMSGKKFFK